MGRPLVTGEEALHWYRSGRGNLGGRAGKAGGSCLGLLAVGATGQPTLDLMEGWIGSSDATSGVLLGLATSLAKLRRLCNLVSITGLY